VRAASRQISHDPSPNVRIICRVSNDDTFRVMATFSLQDLPIDRDAMRSLSARFCMEHNVLAIGRTGDALVIAVTKNDATLLDEIAKTTGKKIETVRVTEAELSEAVRKYYRELS
jgi:hypothetical protein